MLLKLLAELIIMNKTARGTILCCLYLIKQWIELRAQSISMDILPPSRDHMYLSL